VLRPGDANQYLREIGEDPPIMGFVRVGQCRACHLAAESQVVQFALHRTQTGLDVAPTFPIGQLREGHGQILIPAGKSAQPEVAPVALDAPAKLPVGKEADQLREDGTALAHEPLSAVPGAQTSRSNVQIAASSKQTQLITGPSLTFSAPCFSRTVVIGTVAFAGLREGELRGLWGTDDSGNYLQIRPSVWRCFVKERGKNVESGCEERPAEVPIINPLRKVLDCVPHGSSWLFPNSLGGPVDLTNFADRIIKPALKKSGLKWYGWHAYRRGLATNLKELGIDDLVIQRLLRHGDVGTTQKSYIKVRNMRVEDAMHQLAQAFEACTDSVQLPEQPKLVN
jgi:hypothetical protein